MYSSHFGLALTPSDPKMARQSLRGCGTCLAMPGGAFPTPKSKPTPCDHRKTEVKPTATSPPPELMQTVAKGHQLSISREDRFMSHASARMCAIGVVGLALRLFAHSASFDLQPAPRGAEASASPQ